MKNIFNKKGNQKGFTLIEIMVSLGIFAVVAVIAVGAFLKIIDANKQSQSLQTAMNNTNFALESMVREMRVGTNYWCFDAIPPASLSSNQINTCNTFAGSSYSEPGIAFLSSTKSQDGTCNLIHAYRLNTPSVGNPFIEKAEQTSCSDNAWINNFIPLTAADLNIQSFDMKVDGGISGSEHFQPKVFLMIRAFAGPSERERTYFTVQTTASQRSMIGS